MRADVWSCSGVGHHAAATYRAVRAKAATPEALAATTRYTLSTTARHLLVLNDYGLVEETGDGAWQITDLDVTAATRGRSGHGRGIRRALALRVDRAVHAWWRAELAWLSQDRAAKRRAGRRAACDQYVLPGTSVLGRAYPRTHNGRPDHARAWRIEAVRLDIVSTVIEATGTLDAAGRIDLVRLAAGATGPDASPTGTPSRARPSAVAA